MALRDGRSCTKCLDERSVLPALRYRCYRSSALATAPIAASIALHRALGTWANDVDIFIALTEFQRELAIRAGLPAHKIRVKPNCMPTPPLPVQWEKREAKVVFVGRLTTEKGARVVVDAWRLLGSAAPRLEIIGGGTEFKSISESVKSSRLPILLHGAVPPTRVEELLRTARLLILPSICFESFSLSALEAMAQGVPLAASRLGALSLIVREGENGALFEPNNPADLARTISRLWSDQAALEALARAARADFDARYSEGAYVSAIRRIYAEAISNAEQ